jgi:hypothetical protein
MFETKVANSRNIQHSYIHTYILTHVRTYMHTCIRTYMHSCMHTHTHLHTHLHTYVHTYGSCTYPFNPKDFSHESGDSGSCSWTRRFSPVEGRRMQIASASCTLASRIWSSASANLLPIHVRRPYPNGSDTNGCILFPAARGHWSDLSHRSGRNRSGAGKFSSTLLTTRWGNMTCVCGEKHNTIRINADWSANLECHFLPWFKLFTVEPDFNLILGMLAVVLSQNFHFTLLISVFTPFAQTVMSYAFLSLNFSIIFGYYLLFPHYAQQSLYFEIYTLRCYVLKSCFLYMFRVKLLIFRNRCESYIYIYIYIYITAKSYIYHPCYTKR